MEKLNTINQLLNEIQTISESYKRVAEATGENFNIFSVLQMDSDEVKTHSRFLAELLNPKGSHGQNDVFLKKFVEITDTEKFDIGNGKTKNFDINNAKVDVEFFIGQVTECTGGRIDILIRSGENVIMIENKIYAPEQPNQLLRYINKFPKGKLLYLTLYGDKSEKECTENFFDNDSCRCVRSEEYICISYKEHIINWLEECRKDITTIPILRETITQYIHLIKKLTRQNINTKMSEDIANRVIKDEQSFEAFSSLVKATDEVRKQIFLQELFPLIGEIAKTFDLELGINQDQLLNNTDKWGAFFWFKNSKLESLNLLICFAFHCAKGYRGFIHGFNFIDSNGKKDFSSYVDIKSKFQNSFINVKGETIHWLCCRYFDEYWDFEDFETLKKVKFGDFKSDFKEKVKEMLNIINSIEVN